MRRRAAELLPPGPFLPRGKPATVWHVGGGAARHDRLRRHRLSRWLDRRPVLRLDLARGAG